MELELRHLRAICAIADTGSLTKAAVALGASQPALTAQLQRIEHEIGGRLFERGRHGATPTVLGRFVLTRAQAVLLGMEELRRGAAQQAHSTTQVVRLGGAVAPVSIGLADRLSDHLRDLQVQVHTEYSPRLVWDLLVAGRLDAGAMMDYPGYELHPGPDMGCEVIAVEPVFVALWSDHPLAGHEEVELAALAGQPWALTPPDGAGWPECFHTACQQAGFMPQVPYQISETAPIREMVARRRAVAPCQAVFVPGTGVVVRPLAGAPLRLRHLLVWRRDGPLAAHAAALLRFSREAYWAHARQQPAYLAWLERHAGDQAAGYASFSGTALAGMG